MTHRPRCCSYPPFLAMLAVLLVAGLPASPPAWAADGGGYHWVATWGAPAPDGTFSIPTSMASDADGNLYIVDRGNHRVHVMAPDGTLLRAFGALGNGPGEFYWPSSIAVRGDYVCVGDDRNSRVQVFTRSGAYVRQVGGYQGSPNPLFGVLDVAADARVSLSLLYGPLQLASGHQLLRADA
jgi:hypothetical protein